MPLKTNIQRYPLHVPAPAGEPGSPQSARRAQSPTWVGNPWAAAPGVRSEQRPPQAIPAEAGARGCHTCITEPTRPPPAVAQRAARPRRTEHRGWEAPGSPNQSLTRSLLGLGIKDIRCGQLFISKSPSDSRQSVWDCSVGRDPVRPQAIWICRPINIKLLILQFRIRTQLIVWIGALDPAWGEGIAIHRLQTRTCQRIGLRYPEGESSESPTPKVL